MPIKVDDMLGNGDQDVLYDEDDIKIFTKQKEQEVQAKDKEIQELKDKLSQRIDTCIKWEKENTELQKENEELKRELKGTTYILEKEDLD